MQAFSRTLSYDAIMQIDHHGERLKAFREAAGLSQRALAREIGEQYSNVRYWETSGNLPRSNVLIPMAKVLGVTLEELLGEPKPKRSIAPGGRLGKLFVEVSKLPRRQQNKVVEFVEAFVAQQNGNGG